MTYNPANADNAPKPEMDIMIETHAMLNYRIAVKMAKRLAGLDIAWYEEPAVLKVLKHYALCVNAFLRMWQFVLENGIILVLVSVHCWRNMFVI